MVENRRDGKPVYLTNSRFASWDDVFYSDGVGAWLAKLDDDPKFFLSGDAFRGLKVHGTCLQGGDASSDSYCFTS